MSGPFRFLIVDNFDGAVKGTNDEDKANDHSYSEDFFVIDTQHQLGQMWITDGGPSDIEEM